MRRLSTRNQAPEGTEATETAASPRTRAQTRRQAVDGASKSKVILPAVESVQDAPARATDGATPLPRAVRPDRSPAACTASTARSMPSSTTKPPNLFPSPPRPRAVRDANISRASLADIATLDQPDEVPIRCNDDKEDETSTPTMSRFSAEEIVTVASCWRSFRAARRPCRGRSPARRAPR